MVDVSGLAEVRCVSLLAHGDLATLFTNYQLRLCQHGSYIFISAQFLILLQASGNWSGFITGTSFHQLLRLRISRFIKYWCVRVLWIHRWLKLPSVVSTHGRRNEEGESSFTGDASYAIPWVCCWQLHFFFKYKEEPMSGFYVMKLISLMLLVIINVYWIHIFLEYY